jgi:hypothetical protein
MSRDTSFYQYTEYPKIYEGSYWGNFDSKPEDNIANNRNSFITDYNIKKYVKHMSRYGKKIEKYMKQYSWFNGRHLELYSINDSKTLLALYSPYDAYHNKDYKQQVIADGWTEIYPLYSNTAVSFVKYI